MNPSNNVILTAESYKVLDDYLLKLKSLSNKHFYNILNNMITYQHLVSIDARHAFALNSDVYNYAEQCYNKIFAAELFTTDGTAINVTDINNYEEFYGIIDKMKCLKDTVLKFIKSNTPATISNFHMIYYQDVTSHVQVALTSEPDIGMYFFFALFYYYYTYYIY